MCGAVRCARCGARCAERGARCVVWCGAVRCVVRCAVRGVRCAVCGAVLRLRRKAMANVKAKANLLGCWIVCGVCSSV